MEIQEAYKKLFKRLVDADLLGDGPVLWRAPKQEALSAPATKKELENLLNAGGGALPGIYHEAYVAPLVRNLKWALQRCRPGTIETLAGAIYDHAPQSKVQKELKPFLAVISNLYRSFIEPEPSAKANFPEPEANIPPLATFRPKLDLAGNDFGPFTLPADEVERLCGGKVGVVSLPSCYRKHPVICWACVAHEAGGHDVLHAYRGLLREMQKYVRAIFYKGPDPTGRTPRDPNVLWGLLWQYWLEEAAPDVCAVMNLGPSYGLALAVYMAALNERITRYFVEEVIKKLKNQLERERDKQKQLELKIDVQAFENRIEKGKKLPRLTVSWPPPEFATLEDVNSHPTDIFKIYVVIGAIEVLPLDPNIKATYIEWIEKCVEVCLENDKILNKTDNKDVVISGTFQFKPGHWVTIDKQKPLRADRKRMQEKAKEVGRTIAETKYSAFNGHRLQNLETWNASDEGLAKAIRDILKDKTKVKKKHSVDQLGDDAQLLSGALLALFEAPGLYGDINKRLNEALNASFDSDIIWGPASWHPFASGNSESESSRPVSGGRPYSGRFYRWPR